jgi:hypothetical protein
LSDREQRDAGLDLLGSFPAGESGGLDAALTDAMRVQPAC